MKPVAFDYALTTSVEEAIQKLKEGAGAAKIIAGGQSLGPMLNLRLARPATLVDIGGIDELKAIVVTADRLRVGARVTHAEIEDGILAGHEPGLLQTVASRIAYRAVRNRGTIGGSISHADPAADWVLAMTALDAMVVVRGENGERRCTLPEFMLTAFTTTLDDMEIVVAVEPRRLSPNALWCHRKVSRKVGKFADAATIVIFDQATGFANVVIGRPDSSPAALPQLAALLGRGGMVPVDTIANAVDEVVGPQDDYDRHIQISVLEEALNEVTK